MTKRIRFSSISFVTEASAHYKFFHPSIAFVGKDGAYQSGAPYHGFTDGGLLTTIYFL
jgi:hypothetical protein